MREIKKILITGATGFIGGHLSEFFLEKGYRIIAHGSSSSSIDGLRKRLVTKGYNTDNYEFWTQNFLNKEFNYPNLSEIDAILHCAALTKVRQGILENYDKYYQVNVLGTKRIAKEALKSNLQHFIHFSSGQVFGTPSSFPIDEATPKNPINLYGFTKLISEEIVRSLGILGLNHSIVRPFSVYGKRHSNIISIIRDKHINSERLTIFGDGTQTRSFMHINDICNAIALILWNKKTFNQEYNLSGPKEYSVNDLVFMYAEKFGKTVEVQYSQANVNEISRNYADTSKLQTLGFNYRHSLEEFIKRE